MSPIEVDATASLPEEDIIPGSPYHFIGIAGIGGAGTVYKAIDKKVQRTVAIKAISPSLFERFDGEKFEREAKAISKLQHPNVLTILDSGSMTDGRPFLVTEWIEGCTLAQYLKRYGNLSLEAAEEVFCSVLDGLSHAHNRQIVHRDVKPGNIMLSRTKYGWIVKVIDFGTAKDIGTDQNITRNEDMACSPHYVSPEQLKELPIDNRADLYSLGCTMFEALTGRPPFTGRPIVVAMRHQSESPPSLSSASTGSPFPAYIEQIIARLLAKDPDERFANAEAVKAAIQAKQYSADKNTGTLSKIAASVRRHQYAVLVSFSTLVIPIFALSAIHQFQKSPQPASSSERAEETAFRERLSSIREKWLTREGSFKQAAAEMESLLQEAITKFGKASFATIETLQAIERIYDEKGKSRKAIAIHEKHLQSLAFDESTADFSSSSTRAIANACACNLAGTSRLKFEIRKYSEAEALAQRALKIKTKIAGPNSYDVAANLLLLGIIQLSTKQDSAIDSLEKALTIFRAPQTSDSKQIETTLYYLAEAYFRANRFDEAKSALENCSDTNNDFLEERQRLMSLILLRQNDRQRAEEQYTKVLTATKNVLTTSSIKFRIKYLLDWAETCQLSPDRIDDSRRAATQALNEIGESRTSDDRAFTVRSKYHLALAEFYSSNIDKAIADLKALLQECKAKETNAKGTIYRGLGQCFYGRGDYRTAETYYRQALALPNASADDRFMLAIALFEQGKLHESKVEFEENLKEAQTPSRNFHRLISNIFLARISQRQGNKTEAKEQLDTAFKTFAEMRTPEITCWLPAWYLSLAAGELGLSTEQKHFADLALAEINHYYPKSPARTTIFNYQKSLQVRSH